MNYIDEIVSLCIGSSATMFQIEIDSFIYYVQKFHSEVENLFLKMKIFNKNCNNKTYLKKLLHKQNKQIIQINN